MAEITGKRYVFSIRLIHFLMAGLIIFNIFLGFYTENMPKNNPARPILWNFHYSVGFLVVLFACQRLFFRLFSVNPRNPLLLGRVLHKILYIFMFLIPISGYLMASFGGRYVEFFGTPIPLIFQPHTGLKFFFKMVHIYSNYFLIAAIAGHIGSLIVLFFTKRTIAKALYKTIKLM